MRTHRFKHNGTFFHIENWNVLLKPVWEINTTCIFTIRKRKERTHSYMTKHNQTKVPQIKSFFWLGRIKPLYGRSNKVNRINTFRGQGQRQGGLILGCEFSWSHVNEVVVFPCPPSCPLFLSGPPCRGGGKGVSGSVHPSSRNFFERFGTLLWRVYEVAIWLLYFLQPHGESVCYDRCLGPPEGKRLK